MDPLNTNLITLNVLSIYRTGPCPDLLLYSFALLSMSASITSGMMGLRYDAIQLLKGKNAFLNLRSAASTMALAHSSTLIASFDAISFRPGSGVSEFFLRLVSTVGGHTMQMSKEGEGGVLSPVTFISERRASRKPVTANFDAQYAVR